MKIYTTRHIITIIVILVIFGGFFAFCFGWQYGLALGSAALAYSLTLYFKNPTYPSVQIGYPEWMDTKTVWEMIGCSMLFLAGVLIVSGIMSEGTSATSKAILLPCGYILCLTAGCLTRTIWIRSIPKQE